MSQRPPQHRNGTSIPRSQTYILEDSVAEEMRQEAVRLGWTVSRVAQKAWELAKDRLRSGS